MARVVYYEGLFGCFHNALKRGLMARAQDEYPSYDFEQRFWSDSRPLPPDTVGLVGHSFGGWRALRMADPGLFFIMTLDPRFMPWTRFEAPFAAGHATRFINLYQSGFMGGGCVEWAWNKEVEGDHMDLASRVHVWFELDRLL